MAEYVLEVVSRYYPAHNAECYTQSTTPYYGTITDAENYFKTKLKAGVWFDASSEEKINSLREATRLIEALNFDGTMVNSSQSLHFPTEEHGTPKNILIACYECALALLDDYEPDAEVRNMRASSQAFGGFRSSFDTSAVQEHTMAGIPSAYAWSILRPYLCDPRRLKIAGDC